jgi:prepilin-type processing-associated H-X9-DG protein
MPESQPIPIILDTDIGDNVDDALALGFICQSPELLPVGITTVFRDPMRRAGIAQKVLDAFSDGDVPVACGIGKPLLQSWDRRPPKLYDLSLAPDVDKLGRHNAVQFLIAASFKAIEPITVCCIGPLTNLAVALAQEPTLAERIRIVLMGGMIGQRRPETNISADPEAARIVFASGADITMVGLDVTRQCELTAEQVERIKASGYPHTRLLGRMIDAWMAETHRLPALHDPLAVAMCFDPSLCEQQPMHVEIESSDDPPGAVTMVRPSADSRTRVCTDVDRDRFSRLFLNRVCSPVTRQAPPATRQQPGWTLVELLIVTSIVLLLAALLLPAVASSRERARRMACANNLLQIGMALNNYHDAHGTFPPGYVSVVGPAGEDLGPGWGWAAMLLPHVQHAHLFNSIDFEQGTDAAVNTTATSKNFEIFMCPSGGGGASYAANFGRGDLFQTVDRGDGVFFRNSRVRIKDIEDGSMTLLAGESAAAHWTGASALPPDPKRTGLILTLANRARVLAHTGPIAAGQPAHMPNDSAGCVADFSSMHPGGAQFLFVDGSVRFLGQHINSGVYSALATRAAGDLANAADF